MSELLQTTPESLFDTGFDTGSLLSLFDAGLLFDYDMDFTDFDHYNDTVNLGSVQYHAESSGPTAQKRNAEEDQNPRPTKQAKTQSQPVETPDRKPNSDKIESHRNHTGCCRRQHICCCFRRGYRICMGNIQGPCRCPRICPWHSEASHTSTNPCVALFPASRTHINISTINKKHKTIL